MQCCMLLTSSYVAIRTSYGVDEPQLSPHVGCRFGEAVQKSKIRMWASLILATVGAAVGVSRCELPRYAYVSRFAIAIIKSQMPPVLIRKRLEKGWGFPTNSWTFSEGVMFWDQVGPETINPTALSLILTRSSETRRGVRACGEGKM